MKKYLKLLDAILVDFLTDVKSLRYQLILLAYWFNLYILRHSPENLSYGIALLVSVYAFYFASKVIEFKVPNATPSEEP